MKQRNLIILAGGEQGPLSAEAGTIHKAMLPIHGKPMLDWVLDAFQATGLIDHIAVVGAPELDQLASMRFVTKRLDPGVNVIQNLLNAVSYIKAEIYGNKPGHDGYFISFCDAVFLTPELIADAIRGVEEAAADVVLQYVDRSSFIRDGLDSQRTWIQIDGHSLTGTTLYYVRQFTKLIQYAPKLMQLRNVRKEPEKFFELIHCRERTIAGVEDSLSREIGGRVRVIISPHTRLGMDVDKPSDLSLATRLLESPWRHSYRKAVLIHNPQSGQSAALSPLFRELLGLEQKRYELYSRKADYIEHILGYLRDYGLEPEVLVTKAPGHATELARASVAQGADLVIAAGGDGTINEVVNGLAYSGVTLGIIPMGTVNVLGLQLKIPAEIKAACQVIAQGRSTMIDLGKAGNKYFACMAGIGFDAFVVRKTGSRLKKAFGALAYALTAFRHFLAYRFRPILVRIDDQPILRRGYFAIIGNSKYYGGKTILASQADISDGLLDICIFKHANLFRLFSYFLRRSGRRVDRDLAVEYFQCRRISVLRSGRHEVHIDAEYLCRTPVEISVCPQAIRVAI
ncbi:MAG: hypothetical protein A2087_08720 [Spirochaetes bacterium GWD1_61_31]|nr:MAG: hypothetical protein A2Y37_13095 [Spirochaetes bacterium GWB1_60_80]OHD35366.1 MAG: hypothetical protein A2087_08720 [Spirochaetes bacterium GWD1_61_31]OHD42489.1 MAG: hypothetical protein A2Y35_07890 [Spirochaetes bacterium GWE1_60_18]OHD58217.1 MAG: hypothetical protein A2Y32_04810 [Spirochaetes bacterium GWF1_60_12]HAP42927.1 hypothetical protein [Spirochaetaceae bacterium]